MAESIDNFEKRKRDHLTIAMDPKVQASGASGLEKIDLLHEALPDFNLEQVSLSREVFELSLRSPYFISSMTAGHVDGVKLNLILAQAAEKKGWLMGVGSQRRELFDERASNEWRHIRSQVPRVNFIGNIGMSQVVQSPIGDIQRLVDQLEAKALFVHLNPLQESLQPEGTPQFAGSEKALEVLTKCLPVPVIVKEVGCGFSKSTLSRLDRLGVYAVDVSGFGGTHWGRIEGYRSEESSMMHQIALTFKDWGISTLQSALNAEEVLKKTKFWASGGVRSGLDAAKLFAVGAELVGLAQPILSAAMKDLTGGCIGRQDTEKSFECLIAKMEQMEKELQIAMFCTGCRTLSELKEKKVWVWKN